MQDQRSQTGTRLRAVALFLFVTAGFALFRHSSFVIFNDSHGVYTLERFGTEGLTDDSTPLGRLLAHPFQVNCTGGGGYRPLDGLFCYYSLLYLFVSQGPSFLHLLAVGSIYGALAVAMLAVTRRFVRSEPAAYFAVLLTLASPPLGATSWVFLVGVQALVPLLICLGLLCYWKACEALKGRWIFLISLGVILLLGPWFREFLGIVPILIGLLEVRRVRRPTLLLVIAAAGLLHALYPMALVKLLFLHDLPLRSVFTLGNLGAAMGDRTVRWQAAAHFLPLFPPLLLLLGAAAGLAESWERVRTLLCVRTQATAWSSLLPSLIFVVWLVVVVGLLVSGLAHWLLPLTLCLGIAVIGLHQDLFLPFWFLATFVPILRVFTEHIHFLYATVPAAIILSGAVESLWLRATALRGPGAVVRTALAGCLAIVSADQAVTLYGVYQINHATYRGIGQVARWLRQNVLAGSTVISNVIHGEEIEWYAEGHVEHYWTVAFEAHPERVIKEPVQLQALLTRSAGKNVYLLDVDFDYLPWKASYHRHKFVHQWELPNEALGIVHRTRARYMFLDPLRYLVPRDCVPFLGAPDLVDDFYCGPSRDGRPFTYEVSAEYHLYRVTGDTIRPLESAYPLEPQPVRSLSGYNLVAYRGWYYGIPQSFGPMDLQQTDVTGMPGVIRDMSSSVVESEIHRVIVAP